MSGGAGQKHLRIPEQLRGFARIARKQKWTITYSGAGHLLWTSPAGITVTTGSTPSDSRGMTHARIKLRNAGLKLNR